MKQEKVIKILEREAAKNSSYRPVVSLRRILIQMLCVAFISFLLICFLIMSMLVYYKKMTIWIPVISGIFFIVIIGGIIYLMKYRK